MPVSNTAIVVPLDGSKDAENAMPFAAALARAYQAPVRIVHVIDHEQVRSDTDLSRATDAFRAYALDLAGRNGVPAGTCTAEASTGAPAAAVLEAAAQSRFIVIASHGRGGFKAAFVGSVADKVVRGAKAPVVFVPAVGEPSAAGNRPVMVALDGSEQAEAGLVLGREVAAKLGAPVVLLRSYTMPPPVGAEFVYYQPDLTDTLRDAAQAYLDSVRREGERAIVTLGPAPSSIEQAAAEVDAGLVVMTSHGKNAAHRIALGSTTDRVMHSLRRPLLIVPAREADQGD